MGFFSALFGSASVVMEQDFDEELERARTIVAYHESGHVLACRLHGIRVDRVDVDVRRDRYGEIMSRGGTWHEPYSFDDEDKGMAVTSAAISLAGIEAEARYLYEHEGVRLSRARGDAQDCSTADLRHARRYTSNNRRWYREAEDLAERMVRQNWDQLVRIAREL